MARNGEIWVFISATNHAIEQPANAIIQAGLQIGIPIAQYTNILAWTPPTGPKPFGSWRTAGPWPPILGGNRSFRGYYDPVLDRFIAPSAQQGSLFYLIIDGATGADLTPYSGGQPVTYGNHFFEIAGVATDFANRKAYFYDLTTSQLYVASMDNLPGTLTLIGTLPEPSASTQAAIKICWHPILQAVVIVATKMHAYEAVSGKLTTWNRLDGFINPTGNYVPSSTIFYDPDTTDIISVGAKDWDNDTYSPNYWRLTIT
jgi:hypothetical protein